MDVLESGIGCIQSKIVLRKLSSYSVPVLARPCDAFYLIGLRRYVRCRSSKPTPSTAISPVSLTYADQSAAAEEDNHECANTDAEVDFAVRDNGLEVGNELVLIGRHSRFGSMPNGADALSDPGPLFAGYLCTCSRLDAYAC